MNCFNIITTQSCPKSQVYGLPWWLRWQRICLQCRRPGFDPWVRKIPWRRKWQPTPVSCLENPMDRGGWQATAHGVRRVGHDLTTKPLPPLSMWNKSQEQFSVTQSCPTLCSPINCSPPGYSVHGIFQAEWSGLLFSTPGDFPNPGNQPVSLASPALTGRFFTTSTSVLQGFTLGLYFL